MSLHNDIEFAFRVMPSLLQSEVKRKNNQMRINARCPICGDSQTDVSKKRFWIYEGKAGGYLMAGCFNCGYNRPFSVFLKEERPDDYRDYLMESFKENETPRKAVKKEPEPEPEKKYIPELQYCDRLDTLPEEHPIVKYALGRCIPKDRFDRLWFTREWQKLVNSVSAESYSNPKSEPRLVIPIFSEDGKIESFQGRMLRSGNGAKYMTIKASVDSTKVYGQDTIDPEKTVYLMEGPLDSLFIDNAGAITGGQLSLSDVPYPKTRVWVLDNESRHPDTISRLRTLISQKEKVVLWDRSPWKSKDINEMITEENATKEQITEYLKENSVSGLSATLRLNQWDKSPTKKKLR